MAVLLPRTTLSFLSLFPQLKERNPAAAPVLMTEFLCVYLAADRMRFQAMDEPLVLPSGHAYSEQAVCLMSDPLTGRVVCPQTGSKCNYQDVRRAFII